MAFDQATRARLQRFVTEARHTLEEEFTRQLQNDYGMDPAAGTVAPLEKLRHINDQQRETARILRDTLSHYCASPDTDAKLGLDRIVREQAFTILNRLAALRMAEARGLLIESVGNGYQAKGFQLYARLAGTGLGETGDVYRIYLHSIFDELSQDLPGLFDRFSAQGRLFPREAALIQLLALLNHGEIEPLWAEDETIGWIYQYFNTKEERKAMREASQAPRNSRELAVRNQFFTPRYVVEFLVDNTLGRLWFNWTGGQTALRDRCQYLLVKPDERPEPAKRLRDPRTIKLLDPACGSMHFGLYAFDLFLRIYREAWDWEQAHGPASLDTETGGGPDLKPLCLTYADQATFLLDVPRLIIEHNIYGVDIDARAAQIASLALWLRAQRAWHEAGVAAKERPQTGRGHIVAAVAPPAEVDLRKQFMEGLDPLDAELFERTLFLLRGLPELGVLLQVEQELPSLIRAVFGEHGDLFREEDMAQWQKAEVRLHEALTEFAHVAKGNYQGRLFAEDALQGLRMIDLTRETFDAIVMNPPFGNLCKDTKSYIETTYPTSKNDLLSVFVDRGVILLREGGYLGAITSRTCFFAVSFSEWRSNILRERAPLGSLVDLGHGVMDDAMVEAAAYCIVKGIETSQFPVLRVIKDREKETPLRQLLQKYRSGFPDEKIYAVRKDDFERLPNSPLAYWADSVALKKMEQFPAFEPSTADVRKGLRTGDNFRFVRALWEITPGDLTTSLSSNSSLQERNIAKWVPLVLSGSSQPWFSPLIVALNWKSDGAELRQFVTKYGAASRLIQAEDFYFRPGMSWTRRARRFVPYAVPSGCIPTGSRPMAFPKPGKELLSLAVTSSRVASAFLRFYGEKFEFPNFLEGKVKLLPIPLLEPGDLDHLSKLISESYAQRRKAYEGHEPFHEFSLPFGLRSEGDAGAITNNSHSLLGPESEALIEKAYGFSDREARSLCTDLDEVLQDESDDSDSENSESDGAEESDGDESILDYSEEAEHASYLSYCVGVAFGRWDFRIALRSRHLANPHDPFEALPSNPPGMVLDGDGELAFRYTAGFSDKGLARSYPLEIPFGGILVDDPGNPLDISFRTQTILHMVATEYSRPNLEERASAVLGVTDIREYFRKPAKFFSRHLATYTKSRRKAPIYWPLSTGSGSYTLWVYYSSLTSQTLYTAVNDFIEPKLKQVGQDVATLRNKGNARSHDDERSFERLQTLELELTELRDTLLQIAPTYRPSHDDGVQITAAPLWPLFRHAPWQKLLKDTWAKLEKGDYDWAHLTMAYWPERVREKCKTDKSLAIAHGLEELYVEPEAKTAKPRSRKKGSVE